MTKEEKLKKIELLKIKSTDLKREVDYYNGLQTALKLILNGSYGAFATPYFILYNKHVAGTITAQGRDLTQTMDRVNEDYWYNNWHLDFDLHSKLGIKNVTQINSKRDENGNRIESASIYADTDSLFVSFQPAINHSTWKNIHLNSDFLSKLDKKFVILEFRTETKCDNSNYLGSISKIKSDDLNEDTLDRIIKTKNPELIIIDGYFVKDRDLNKKEFQEILSKIEIIWNWSNELDYIHGIDHFRYGNYFKDCLEKYASSFGVPNEEDFELERISESIINISKKKYIQHIVYEDGIPYERLNYLFPKGVELVRSSTPLFAREKIIEIVKYLFSHPDDFNIKDLLKLVKNLRREFELADIDEISMQSSCSNYESKVLEDKDHLSFVSGTHFAVKGAAYYNYLLYRNKVSQQKFEFIKSGAKIKYYYCKNKKINDIFAYMRGFYPMEFAPDVDYDLQFEKAILSPINSIIEPLNMPQITKRLSVVVDIFGGL